MTDAAEAMASAEIFALPRPVRQAESVCTIARRREEGARMRTSRARVSPSAPVTEGKMKAQICGAKKSRNAAAGRAKKRVLLTAKVR